MWLFGKKDNTLVSEQVQEEQIGKSAMTVDFDIVIGQITKLSNKAMTTFLYKLVGALPQKVVITLEDYVAKRLSNGKANVNRSEQRYTSREDTGSTGFSKY